MKSKRVRVVHLVESLGGGVMSALESFVDRTPQVEHHLVGRVRSGSFSGFDRSPFESVTVIDGSLVRLMRAHIKVVDLVEPSVVHLHSSWAGLIGRLSPRKGAGIVYSPHCFFHERTDLPRIVRTVARGVERGLGLRTDLLVGVSPWEANEGDRLGIRSSWVENRFPKRLQSADSSGSNTRARLVVTAGRISAQKDPGYFLEVKRAVDLKVSGVRWLWVGDGDPALRNRLISEGVHVSGWVGRSDALDLVRQAGVYVHTAAWEAAPLTLVEAEEAEVPIVVRSQRSLQSLGWQGVDTAVALGELVAGGLEGHGVPSRGNPDSVPASLPDIYFEEYRAKR
ncbi:glycosyltransferase [Curtobacterium pusillum]|uniref:glycosyltransferase n=1 Tax=Curtobacterium pusillum TaxID=69373 RepID=UPI0011A9CF3C|nr:glycosyltransferase [Curtobacterium pusillum]